MDRQGVDRLFANVGRAAMGALGFGCLTASLLLGPSFLSDRWRSGTPGDFYEEAPSEHRQTVGAEVVEATYGPGFQEAADLVVAGPTPPAREELRRLAEERGVREVWYSVKVRWLLDDGDDAIVTYMRTPLEQPFHYDEFLLITRGAPLAPGGDWPPDESARLGRAAPPRGPGE